MILGLVSVYSLWWPFLASWDFCGKVFLVIESFFVRFSERFERVWANKNISAVTTDNDQYTNEKF